MMRKQDKINYFKVAFVASTLLLMNVSLVSIASAETNLVSNPGFEGGTTVPSSWTFETFNGNTPIWDSIAHSGSRSIKISVPGTTSIFSGIIVSNFISARPGQNYTFSAWVKTQSTGGTNVPIVKVVEADANGYWLRETTLTFGKGTYDWSQQKEDFQTGPGTAIFYVTAGIYDGYGTIWVDDVSLSLKDTATSPSSDNIYFVAKNGNDNNPGSEASPWLTIQKAVNTAVAGDTIYIKAGTYAERIDFPNSGSAGNYITLQNYSTDIVTVSAPGGPYTAYPDQHNGLFEIIGKSYIRVKGLRFADTVLGQTIVIERGSNNIIIDGNIFDNITGAAVIAGYNNDGGAYSAWNIDVINNYIYRKGTASSPGEYVELLSFDDVGYPNVSYNTIANQRMGECIVYKQGTEHGVVSYNNISNCYSSMGNAIPPLDYNVVANRLSQAIYVDGYASGINNISVFGNIAWNTEGILAGSEQGGRNQNLKIYNNIVYNGYYGIIVDNYLHYRSDGSEVTPDFLNIYIMNNVAYNNFRNFKSGGTGFVNIVWRNNIGWIGGNGYMGSPYNVVDHNLFDIDPQFIDATNHNFHLQSNSSAIDAGSSVLAPGTDYDGNPRPLSGSYDIGAFEN
jgi:hypothetical protein